MEGRRIVLTGGPGGGKTTAADLFRRELGEAIVVVPESATMLFSGGFPRASDDLSVELAQFAIYHVQQSLEETQHNLFPGRTLLCDRGTVDGVAYWPERADKDFFSFFDSSIEDELGRYDGVIFFETAAAGGISIEGGNPIRNESLDQAVVLDRKLQSFWSQHRNYAFVPHCPSFMEKMNKGLAEIRKMINHVNGGG